MDNNKAINKVRNINNDWIWEKGFGLWLEGKSRCRKKLGPSKKKNVVVVENVVKKKTERLRFGEKCRGQIGQQSKF